MINKKELIRRTQKKISGMTQADMEVVIDEMFDTIIETLKGGEEIYLAGFGKFSLTKFKAIDKPCPDGKTKFVPAHVEPKFKFFKTAKKEFLPEEE